MTFFWKLSPLLISLPCWCTVKSSCWRHQRFLSSGSLMSVQGGDALFSRWNRLLKAYGGSVLGNFFCQGHWRFSSCTSAEESWRVSGFCACAFRAGLWETKGKKWKKCARRTMWSFCRSVYSGCRPQDFHFSTRQHLITHYNIILPWGRSTAIAVSGVYCPDFCCCLQNTSTASSLW